MRRHAARYAVGNVFLDRCCGLSRPRFLHEARKSPSGAAKCVDVYNSGEDGTTEGKRIFEQLLGVVSPPEQCWMSHLCCVGAVTGAFVQLSVRVLLSCRSTKCVCVCCSPFLSFWLSFSVDLLPFPPLALPLLFERPHIAADTKGIGFH